MNYPNDSDEIKLGDKLNFGRAMTTIVLWCFDLKISFYD